MAPAAILTTHHHYDHAGGNKQMKKMYPNIEIIGGEDDKVAGETIGVKDKQVIEVNGLSIMCYHTPCHTRGSQCYFITPTAGAQEGQKHTTEHVAGFQVTKNCNRACFTGDTIFVGGAGRFMEGNAE